jgi:hypothetical protein
MQYSRNSSKAFLPRYPQSPQLQVGLQVKKSSVMRFEPANFRLAVMRPTTLGKMVVGEGGGGGGCPSIFDINIAPSSPSPLLPRPTREPLPTMKLYSRMQVNEQSKAWGDKRASGTLSSWTGKNVLGWMADIKFLLHGNRGPLLLPSTPPPPPHPP